ncbi:MAG: PepSY domain-containing protein [Paracoccaceae bacterium]
MTCPSRPNSPPSRPCFCCPRAGATGTHEFEATDQSTWLNDAEITEKLEATGWSARFVKEDGGCWEVYGTNPDGKRVEGYFHPVTGEPELIAQRGRILFRADDGG